MVIWSSPCGSDNSQRGVAIREESKDVKRHLAVLQPALLLMPLSEATVLPGLLQC